MNSSRAVSAVSLVFSTSLRRVTGGQYIRNNYSVEGKMKSPGASEGCFLKGHV